MRRGKKQKWTFSKGQALPRLAYISPSSSEKKLRPTQFWLVGGAYQVDEDGLHARSGDGGIMHVPIDDARAMPAMAGAVRNHRLGHGNIDPRVAVRVSVPDVPTPLVEVGPLAAIIYGDDKGDGVGFGPFIHDIVVPCRPTVYVSSDGTQIHIIGGRMAVFEGWLHDVPV